MKILVLSDSHSVLRFIRLSIDSVKPDAVIHLGDYFEDGQVIAAEYPHIPFYQVPGNCDRYRCTPYQQEILVMPIDGVTFYMTHGHKHMVKSGTDYLIGAARSCGAQAVLYGHTHRTDCRQEPDGLWVLNPGSSGSAGVIRTQGGRITSCYILRQSDLEA